MATGTSDYWGNKLLNFSLGGAALSAPTTVYLALFNVMPTKASTGATEVSGGSYARQAITCSSANFPAASAQLIKLANNGASVTFPTATADWSTPSVPTVGWGFYDAVTSGNLLYMSPFISTWYPMTATTTGNTFRGTGYTPSAGDTVMLEAITGVALPGGFSADTVYYVISPSGDTFSLSATSGGSAITVSADGGGLVGVVQAQAIRNGNMVSVATNQITIQGS